MTRYTITVTIFFKTISLLLFLVSINASTETIKNESITDTLDRRISLTISPIGFIPPLFIIDLTGEFCIRDKAGVAAMFSGGLVPVPIGNNEERSNWFTIGGQFRWYLLGNFTHGMQTGVQIEYGYLKSKPNTTYTFLSDGLFFGPFIGYKFVSSIGFTFDTQLGLNIGILHAQFSKQIVQDNSLSPLGNIKIGWSF